MNQLLMDTHVRLRDLRERVPRDSRGLGFCLSKCFARIWPDPTLHVESGAT
jgi:hypothetical protein